MKKVFVFAAVAAALIGLTSCDKDKQKCWNVTLSLEIPLTGTTMNQELYTWDSENHIEVYVEDLKSKCKAQYGDAVKMEVSHKSASKYKNETDCLAQNPAAFLEQLGL